MTYNILVQQDQVVISWENGENRFFIPRNQVRFRLSKRKNKSVIHVLAEGLPNDIEITETNDSTINGLNNPDLILNSLYNSNPAPLTTTTTLEVIENIITVLEKGNWCINVIEGFIKLHSHSLGDSYVGNITEAVFLSATGAHPEIPTGAFPNTLNINTGMAMHITGVGKIMVCKGAASFSNTIQATTNWDGSSF